MKTYKKHPIWFMFTFVFLMISSCSYFVPQAQGINKTRDEFYAFDPYTVSNNIVHEKENLFTQIVGTSIIRTPNKYNPVRWTEDNYYEIARAAHKEVWDEDIDIWNLRHMLFNLDCSQILEGPQFGWFIFTRIEKITEKEHLIEHNIYIDPIAGTIHLVEKKYSPNLITNIPVVSNERIVSVRDALKIAEESGGDDIRDELEDKCEIAIELFGNSDDWRISYVVSRDVFVVEVDLLTGVHQVTLNNK